MPSKKTEWTVTDREGEVKITKLANNRLEIKWFCGTSRRFDPDALVGVIDRVERMSEVDPDHWHSEYDSPGYDFDVRLKDGRLYAVERNAASKDDPNWYSVKWDGRQGFKAALEKAIASTRPVTQRAKAALTGS